MTPEPGTACAIRTDVFARVAPTLRNLETGASLQAHGAAVGWPWDRRRPMTPALRQAGHSASPWVAGAPRWLGRPADI